MRTSWPTPIRTTPTATASPAGRTWSGATEHEAVVLGRFGWKAGEPTHRSAGQPCHGRRHRHLQPAGTRRLGRLHRGAGGLPRGAGRQQPAVRRPRGVPRQMMDQILFYARNLAVPARRDADDPTVLRGKRLFYQSGCTGCHVPKLATRRDWEVRGARRPADLAVQRPASARHGRGSGRRPARGCGERSGVAHAAALGHRSDRGRSTAIPTSCTTGAPVT